MSMVLDGLKIVYVLTPSHLTLFFSDSFLSGLKSQVINMSSRNMSWSRKMSEI